nr:type I polyketide synthase [Sciscionella marina]
MVDEPLAIVGMGCRYPGGIDSPEQLWRVLEDGRHVSSVFPADRGWDLDALRDGQSMVDRGGFLDGAADFDAEFFGISPREAAAMDPQQRLVLETAWETLERAGIDPNGLRESSTGVFLGAESRDYGPRLHEAPAEVAGHLFTGTAGSVLSGRVAYTLGLRGPALTVDTSASSSLVALHLAATAVRRGECTLALAGGVSVLSLPGNFVAFTGLRGLAPDGRCKPFSTEADGTAWSEGVGMLAVEPLSRARRSGHPVLAVLRGSAINSDGPSSGLTAPDGEAQQAVIRAALAEAGIRPADVDAVEAHGTGTPLGDATEAGALLAAYGKDRPADRPLLIGSVKSNIGHTLAAAGVAGVLKIVLALRHGLLPESVSYGDPIPAIESAEALRTLTEPLPWRASGRPRRAGVSGFGIGGTNAHVLIEEPPAEQAPPVQDTVPVLEAGMFAWPVSGHTSETLAAQAGRLQEFVHGRPDLAPVDVAWSLVATRPVFERRAVVLGADRAELADGLAAAASGQPAAGLVTGSAPPGGAGRTVFVFPGQGSQWLGMGRELARSSPVFAARLADCAAALGPYVDWSLDEVLAGAHGFEATDVVQPALWAVMVSLAQVWRAVGVTPDAVVGHSQGEIAAAVVAGILSLDDAARVVALRSKALMALAGRGGMLAVEQTAETVREWISPWHPWLSIAAVNGPRATVVSGEPDALRELAEAHAEVRTRMIPVDYASHSAHVEELHGEIRTALAGITPGEAGIPLVSAMTGETLTGPEMGADYWYASLREPVEFERAIRVLGESGHGIFIETSPHPVLTAAVLNTLDGIEQPGAVLGTLRREDGGADRLLRSFAEAQVRGAAVDWRAVSAGGARVELPTYAFQRERFWLSGGDSAPVTAPVARTEPAAGRRAAALADPLDLVRAHAAVILGHLGPDAVRVDRTFKELGFDSVTTVELRNRLAEATSLALPASLAFDRPTPTALAAYLRAELGGTEEQRTEPVTATAAEEPIAILGIGCKLPGGIDDAEQLWQAVATGADLVGEYPADRGWDVDQLGASGGGFVPGAAEFDAGFFGISPREAVAMDPQQRVLLEVSWEAMERAGIDPRTLRGTAVGVYAGAFSADYGGVEAGVLEAGERGGHLMTGVATSVLSGRVSYTLALEGPAVTVDTACSSSLVALHLASRALRSGECSLAIAGGVTLHATPEWLAWFTKQGGLAPDGRCKAFSAEADGMGMAEGAGMVVLERLSEARRHGHPVLAVIRGSAINSDGASNGLTAPSGPAQQRVIRAALADAALSAGEVDVVEAHGTGTPLGDPIEANALLATYGSDRTPENPVLLGTVKSNLGHPQAAAGVTGVIKMVSALRRGTVPATLHADTPTADVDWSAGRLRIVTEATPWPDQGRPRRAGVSSFGISGTNAHLILEQAPAEQEPPARTGQTLPVLAWPVSAHTADAVPAQARRLAEFLGDSPGLDPGDVGRSLATTRAALEHRVVLTGQDRDTLLDGLTAVAEGGEPLGLITGTAGTAGRCSFVFTGQGAQRLGMGRELHAAYPVFAEAFDAVCAELDRHLERPLTSVVHGSEPELADETMWAQAGLFAVEVALVELLRAWGIGPDAVAGHSIGELAAAYTAGVWSLADACRLVAARGRLMQALPRGGAMVAVTATEEAATAVLAEFPGAALAAVNAPGSVVLSGTEAAVSGATERLAEDGARTRRLRVSHAFHSPLMEPMLADFAEVATSLRYREPGLALISGVTGRPVSAEVTEPGYWVRQVREPVRFADTVAMLRELGTRTFLEIGPDAALTAMCTPADGEEWLPLSRRDRPEPDTLAAAVAGVHVRGGELDWEGFYRGSGARCVDLPTYAFQRDRYWLHGDPASGDAGSLGLVAAGHPLLGAAIGLADGGELVLTGRLSRHSHPWLGDHVVAGAAIVPGTALVEMAIRAGDETGCGRVAELVIENPMVVPERGGLRVQLAVGLADAEGHRAVSIYSQPDDEDPDRSWTRCATGVLAPAEEGAADAAGLAQWPPAGAVAVDLSDFYPALAERGLSYGPLFQGVRSAWRRGEEIFAEVALPEGTPVDGFGVHPALFDAALHGLVALGPGAGTRVPFAWNDVVVHAADAAAAKVRIAPAGDGVSVVLADAAGTPIASVGSLVLRELTAEAVDRDTSIAREALFRVEWQAAESVGGDADTAGWALLGPDSWLGIDAPRFADPAELVAAVRAGAELPHTVVACRPAPDSAVDGAIAALELVQAWFAEVELGDARLVVVTRNAMDAEPGVPVRIAEAPVVGLLRTAATEHPGRLVLADLDELDGAAAAVVAGAGLGEPEFAVRGGELRVPRLVRPTEGLALPERAAGSGGWALGYVEQGTLDSLTLREADNARPLEPGEVRVGLRASGVNFRDVLTVLGVYPGPPGPLGLEAAGTVLELGPGVDGFAVGDAVVGVFTSAFSPVAVTDARLLAPKPAGWSWAQAAAAPVAYATAYHALVDLAGLGAGESVLVHAAAGGVGLAAVQLAHHLGATVFGTASPVKWPVIRAHGVPGDRLSSSRTLDFAEAFHAATEGRGVDVVLNALTGEFVDASVRLLAPGGRFVELGKTDPRDPAEIQRRHGVSYAAFDLLDEGAPVIGPILAALRPLFASGRLRPPPVSCWDVRQAGAAFRHLSQGRNLGKVVLTIPAPADPEGTVLVTGASGGLGGLVARHVITSRRARNVVLTSRRGMAAEDMPATVAALAEAGARVRVAACDSADRDGLLAVLDAIPDDVPLKAVVHAAGILDDAALGSLSGDRMASVMRPKVDGAWLLHELTADAELDSFVLFSSVAGIWGTPGQGNYAAANAFLDALAAHRRQLGLPATSLAWGPWSQAGGMAGTLSAADRRRLTRNGLLPLGDREGLALFDAALRVGEPVLVPARVDVTGAAPPPLLSRLVRRPARRSAGSAAPTQELADRVGALPPEERQPAVLRIVRTESALVLGMAGPEEVEQARSFRELGFDSLTAVELRNRLVTATGLRLGPTLTFDYPTPDALAGHLLGAIGEEEKAPSRTFSVIDELESLLTAAEDQGEKAKALARLEGMLRDLRSGEGVAADGRDLAEATDDEIFEFIDTELGISDP